LNPDDNILDALDERWPVAGDRLFVESMWRYDGYIVRDRSERFYRLPMGYKRAGDLLANQAAADVVDRRNVLYAALFCYRQAIELFLKRLVDEFGKAKPKKNHDLDDLWKGFMGIVNERGASEILGLTAMATLVAEMHQADKASDGFRFPTDYNDAPFQFGDRGIDLANLREVMQGLENFFECVYTAFSEEDASASYFLG
jgi:hypothetical protein